MENDVESESLKFLEKKLQQQQQTPNFTADPCVDCSNIVYLNMINI